MKLQRVGIDRLPGIDLPFALEDLAPGMNIIVGPNGVGKSRLCHAVQGLLWQEFGQGDGEIEASMLLEHEGETYRVERSGPRYVWQRIGEGSSEDVAPPARPDLRLNSCFFLGLRDLLDASERAGHDLAREVRTQISGGYDLEAARTVFEPALRKRAWKKERKALDAADGKIRSALRAHEELARDEAQLGEIEEKKQEADRAGRRLASFDIALALQDLRLEHAGYVDSLDELPGALAALEGRELDRTRELAETIAGKREKLSAAKTAFEEARDAASKTRLADEVDAALLGTWAGRADELSDLARRLAAVREALVAARVEASSARTVAGGMDPGAEASALDLEGAESLFAFLQTSQQNAAERTAADEQLRALGESAFGDEDRERLVLLGRAVDALRSWLRAPDVAADASEARIAPSRTALLLLAGALVVAGGLLGALVDASLFAVAGIGVGLAAAALVVSARVDRDAVPDARRVAQQDYPTTIEPPMSWNAEHVGERLRRWEDEAAALEARAEQAKFRENALKALASRRETIETAHGELASRRQALAAQLGLSEIPADADLVNRARALDRLRTTVGAEVAAAETVGDLERQQGEELAKLGSLLTEHGEIEPTDAVSAQACVRSLQSRSQSLREARAAAKGAEGHRDRLTGEIDQLVGETAGIYRRAELEVGDYAGLSQRMTQLDRRKTLESQRDEAAGAIRREEARLLQAEELGLASLSREQLESEKSRLALLAEQSEALQERLSEIRIAVRNARAGHTIELAIALRDEKRLELRDQRDRALAATAGNWLLDLVRDEHERDQMPPVLARASELFENFTHHLYKLKVSPGDDGSFVAIESKSQRSLGPHELSDGTRVQLLLAARLAFAEDVEKGAHLPLFLDEALDHSDPARFRAIARSLARMTVDDDRQIFYLTNDPTDVERIEDAFREEGVSAIATHDLGLIRRGAASIDSPDRLRAPSLPRVPMPGGESFEDYAVRLGVPGLEPADGAPAQHLAYLLWDDLETLRELLQAQIEHVGQWLQLSEAQSKLAKSIQAARPAGAQLDARAALLDAFCHAVQQGRGRSVDRAAIQASDVFSEHYLETVIAIAGEQKGDARELLRELRLGDDSRLSRLRHKHVEQFEQYLADEGYIVEEPILEKGDVIAHGMGTPAASELPREIAGECIHRWWELATRFRA